MTRDRVLDDLRYSRRPGPRPARRIGLWVLGSALAMGAGWAPDARGSGLFRDLTARDRSQPILLSATGDLISLHSPGHPGSGLASGAIPAYLAFPMTGGEHIPARTPTVETGPQPAADAVGPLALTPSVQGTLNADLMASHGAVVDAPDGSYAVAMLPRYARALAQASSSSSTATGGSSATSVLTSMFGLNPQANWTILGVSTKQLSQWYKEGTQELSHLNSVGASHVSKALGVKVTPTGTGYTVAAQELIPPSASSTSGVSTVATPEPSGWLVFVGLILAAAGLRHRSR